MDTSNNKKSSFAKDRKIKCVIWDLDKTIWNGTLLEDENVILRDNITEVIKALDERGILQSISSKNYHDSAIRKLIEFKLDEYFLCPEINWNSKASSVKKISEDLNIGMDSIAFIDDEEFERDLIKYSYPEAFCIDSDDLSGLLDLPEMNPKYITSDSKVRRNMYQNDITRKKVQENFMGTQEEFLASLRMVFTISSVNEDDLKRAEELTIRTHQLNTTGYTYSYDKLDQIRKSEKYKLFIAGLDDRYGTYGKIGLVLVECEEKVWMIKLLLMSCRVMSRGVGTVLLNYVMKLAKKAGVKLKAEFISNDKNRMMLVTYKFGGFKELVKNDNVIIFKNDLSQIQEFPDYMEVKIN